ERAGGERGGRLPGGDRAGVGGDGGDTAGGSPRVGDVRVDEVGAALFDEARHSPLALADYRGRGGWRRPVDGGDQLVAGAGGAAGVERPGRAGAGTQREQGAEQGRQAAPSALPAGAHRSPREASRGRQILTRKETASSSPGTISSPIRPR